MKPGTIHRLKRNQSQRRPRWELTGAAVCLPFRKGLSCCQPYFQCTTDALAVLGGQSLCSQRIDTCQFGMQGWPALLSSLGRYLLPYLRISFRKMTQSLEKSLVVQHRAADQKGEMATAVGSPYGCRGILEEACSAVGFRRIENVDEMVSGPHALFCAGFCSTNVHVLIHQRRIDTDDLQRDSPAGLGFFCQIQGCRSLAAGSGASQCKIGQG